MTSTSTATPVLQVEDLRLQFRSGSRVVRAVDGVSFSLLPGETLGIVGESGSGKTSLGYGLLGVLPSNATIASGRILLDGIDLVTAPDDVKRDLRWRRIAMVFQNAMAALNPIFTVGDQIIRAIRLHEKVTREAASNRAAKLLERVGVSATRLAAYPHELSGGQRQRVALALAVSCNPAVVIADEPTTALDVSSQVQVLDLLRDLQQEFGMAVIMISHDLGAVTSLCRKIAVFYAGQIVEMGLRESVLAGPQHPYTTALLRAYPQLHGPVESLWTIGGSPPSLITPPSGCRFHPRCPQAQARCFTEVPRPLTTDGVGQAACHFPMRHDAGELEESMPR
jgi:oligopeptide/dipeptide ABC transporter ATP-binding protein